MNKIGGALRCWQAVVACEPMSDIQRRVALRGYLMFLKRLGITVYELHKGVCELTSAGLEQLPDRLFGKIDNAQQVKLTENPVDMALETISALLEDTEYSKEVIDIVELAIGLFLSDVLGAISKLEWARKAVYHRRGIYQYRRKR